MDINFKSYPGTGFRHFKISKKHKKTLRDIERVLKRSLLYLSPHNIYSVNVIKPHWGIFEWVEVGRFENGGCAYKDDQGNDSGLERRVKAWDCCLSTYADLVSKNEIFEYVVICSVDAEGKKEIIHVLGSADPISRKYYSRKRI
jgi:hypothetical protein